MRTIEITRGSSPLLTMTVREGEPPAPKDLTGVPITVIDTDLPTDPTITITEPLLGRANIIFPDTIAWQEGQSYSFKLLIGAPGAPGTLATRDIEVIVS